MNNEIKDRIEKIEQGIVPEGYKETKVGIIPEDWEVKRLGDISEINKSNLGAKDKGLYYYYDLSSVNEGVISNPVEKIKFEDLPSRARRIFEKGDILFSTVRPNLKGFGYTDFEPIESLCSTGFAVIKNKKLYSNQYIYYNFFTKRMENRINSLTVGSNYPALNIKEVRSLEIQTPLLQEQEKIANILSTWDKAIENIQQLIKEKEIQKKGLMQQLLTGETRLPGFTGEWEEVKLGTVVTRKKGKAVEQDEGGKYPILGIKALNSNKFTEFTNDTRVLAEKHDILLLWDGAAAGSIFTDIEGVVGSTFMRLRPTNINSIFVREYMKKDEEYIQNIREGSGIPHIPRDFLDYYKLNLPPLPEQKAIAQILSTADKEIELLNELLEAKQEEKKGLMQLLLTGIVRV